MRRYIIFILSFTFINFISSQISYDSGLEVKLQGKETFNEIKSTVLRHYENQLNSLEVSDSMKRKKIMRQLKMWNRKFWLEEYYTDTDGKVVNRAKIDLEGIEEAKRMTPSTKSNTRNQSIDWINQGPVNGDDGVGRIDVLAKHPTNPNIIYAGSPNGGLYKSIDGTATWTPISSWLPSLGISGIAIHPTNPNIIYVLTGDRNATGYFGNEYLNQSKGVYKTLDGGNTWTKTAAFFLHTGPPIPEPYQGRSLIIDPINPEILLAATNKGLFRTFNGGNSWYQSTGIGNYPVTQTWDVRFKPGNSNVVYAVGDNAFYKSTDGGLNFSQILIAGLGLSSRISLAVTPANVNKVALFAGNPTQNCLVGVFISNDEGETFTNVYSNNNANLFYNYYGNSTTNNQVHYNNCISISPTNENFITVGGLCLWSSPDNGASWVQATAYWPTGANSYLYIHPDQHDIIYDLNGNMIVANDGGVYKKIGSDFFLRSNGLTTTQFYHFERKNDNNSLWGGAQDNGMQEHDVNGNYELILTGDGYDMITDHSYNVANGEGNDSYCSVNNSFYYRWSVTLNAWLNRSVPGNKDFFGNIAMSPNDEDDIWLGYTRGLYSSINNGSDWSLVDTLYPANWCISTVKNDVDLVYTAGSRGNVPAKMSKLNNGAYTDLTASLVSAGYNTALKITDIDVNPNNDNMVYISIGGTLPTSKVFFTNNGGTTWSNWTYNLPNVPIFCIKQDINFGLYVGTSIGVFYKRNNINYWEPFYNGLPQVPITEIELWVENGQPEVWASTFGRGMWYTNQYTTCPTNLTLTGDIQGNQYKEATLLLTSTQHVLPGDATFIKYNSNNKIILQDGFRAYTGSKFKTYTSGCGGQAD